MRVISGCARGHKLKSLEGTDTRPTLDRIKETLFNIIAPEITECNFLDLFSGSGAIGIEALSRGANTAVFVDSSYNCYEVIIENLEHTKLRDKAQVINQDIFDAIKELGNKNQKFDIIFIDPPYEGGYNQNVLEHIIKSNILNEDGLVIVERAAKYDPPQVDGLKLIREKGFGKTTAISFFALED